MRRHILQHRDAGRRLLLDHEGLPEPALVVANLNAAQPHAVGVNQLPGPCGQEYLLTAADRALPRLVLDHHLLPNASVVPHRMHLRALNGQPHPCVRKERHPVAGHDDSVALAGLLDNKRLPIALVLPHCMDNGALDCQTVACVGAQENPVPISDRLAMPAGATLGSGHRGRFTGSVQASAPLQQRLLGRGFRRAHVTSQTWRRLIGATSMGRSRERPLKRRGRYDHKGHGGANGHRAPPKRPRSDPGRIGTPALEPRQRRWRA
mmetsp:Transcript_95968/g.268628  ORF Transcript_95968/g.268628 Transcript_95968/m.268628 type:complete len:264 (+) Transcript_95968:1833-2624(+)